MTLTPVLPNHGRLHQAQRGAAWLLATALWAAPSWALAQPAPPEAAAAPLVGSWQLLSVEMRHADGRTSHPFGAQPQGWALYQANGSMSITLQRSHRPPFAQAQLYAASAAEKASIADSFSAYAGHYVVQPDTATVHHHIALSSFPNWSGTTQVRHYQLDGDTLTLATPPTADGSTVLVWKRMP